MTEALPVLTDRAAALRAEFDHAFSLPPPAAASEVENLLAIRVSGDSYAIRLREITGLVAGRKIVPVPTGSPQLLGLAGIQSQVVPVFGLATLLGYREPTEAPRWIVLCAGGDSASLAFADFHGHVRLPASAFRPDDNPGPTRPFAGQVAVSGSDLLRVLNLPLIVASLRQRVGRDATAQGK